MAEVRKVTSMNITNQTQKSKRLQNEGFDLFDGFLGSVRGFHLAVALSTNAPRVPWRSMSTAGDPLGQRQIEWCDFCGCESTHLTQYTQQTDRERRSTDRPTSVADLCPACLKVALAFWKDCIQYRDRQP